MNAVYFSKHGGPEVLEFGELPTPEAGDGQVLVRLHAAALNRMDLWTRDGYPGLKLELPHIPGADGAGEIAGFGPGVQGWQVGERVVINSSLSCGRCEACLRGEDNLCKEWRLLGETTRGTYAEYVAVPATHILRIPVDYDETLAAAASLVFHTAWHSLIVRGGLRAGESVLVIGASGGVNTAYIQIAALAGATVYVVGSDREKLALAESLGAHVLIDCSQEENWSKAIFQLTQRRGVDVVVDNVGITFPQSFRACRKGGRILTVGNTGGPVFEIDNRYIFAKHLSILGSSMGTRADFATVMGLVFEGKLRPVIDRIYTLSQAPQAQQRLASGAQRGKIVLRIDG